MTFHKIGFFGLGLIGGSLAKTIRRFYPQIELIAYDIDLESARLAQTDGVIDQIAKNYADLCACDLLYLCAPVHTNVAFLTEMHTKFTADCLISDVGSVKHEIYEHICQLGLCDRFIGGHPMAGSERSGYVAATDRLFENAYYILAPGKNISEDTIQKFMQFTASLDALPLILDPIEHDHIVAAISHVPHVLAASLVNMVRHLDSESGTMKTIAAGGFKDITRIASSSPVMWQQICSTNRQAILEVLHSLQNELHTITEHIEQEDATSIHHFFESSKNYRDSFPIADKGPLKSIHYLYCDLIDEAGAIANVSQILAVAHISIRNIGIIHNREYQDGVLRIEFYDRDSVQTASCLLKKYHYTVYEAKK